LITKKGHKDATFLDDMDSELMGKQQQQKSKKRGSEAEEEFLLHICW
jgi:hypothetical protein